MAVEAERPLEPDLRVVVLHALPDEVRFCGPVLGPIESQAWGSGSPGRENRSSATFSVPLALSLCIGVGTENAAQNTERMLIQHPATRAVIIIGYAGGLAAALDPGSLLVADTVSNGLSGPTYHADPTLLSTASEIRPFGDRVHYGALVTADRVLVRSAEKEQYALRTNALAVDMESAGAAAVATEYGVPWLAVRVITDGVNDDLPLDFNALANPDGSVNRGRIVAETLLHPWKIPALIRLGSRSSLASRRLAEFLVLLLSRIGPGE